MHTKKTNVAISTIIVSTIMASGGNLIIPREIWMLLAVIAAISQVGLLPPLRQHGKFVYLWLGLFLVLSIYAFGFSNILSLASRLATFFSALIILGTYKIIGYERLKNGLFNFLCFVSIITITTFILGNIATDFFWVKDVGGVNYHHIGYLINFHFLHDEPAYPIRPNGVFYEPGVLQIYLSLMLLIALFEKKSFTWSSIAIMAILCTQSTIGIANVVICLVFWILKFSNLLRPSNLLKLAIGLLVILPFVANIAIENFDYKFQGEGIGSFVARQYDLFSGLNIIYNNPITGIGFTKEAYLENNALFSIIQEELPVSHAEERMNSNGMVMMFYTIGIPLGLPLLIGLFRQKIFNERLVFALVMTISLMGQSLTFTIFVLILIFSGFDSRIKPKRISLNLKIEKNPRTNPLTT